MRVLLLILLWICGSFSSSSSDLAELRRRVIESKVPTVDDCHKTVIPDAKNYCSTIKPDGHWPDINYKDKSRVNWDPSAHYDRVLIIQQALACLKSPLDSRPQLTPEETLFVNTTHHALAYWFKVDPKSSNWWWNEIDAPQGFSFIALLFQPYFEGKEEDNLIVILKRAKWKGWTGANLEWMVATQMRRGLLTHNFTLTQSSTNVAWSIIEIAKRAGDGIQQDFSFHQHGPELEQGSYGAVFVQIILNNVALTAGLKSFELQSSRLHTFVDLLLEGDQWMMAGKYWDWEVVGREVTRPATHHAPGFNTSQILQLNYREAELKNLADRLNGGKYTPLSGNRHFYCSDYVGHRRDTWSMSIHMRSKRTIPARCVNEECKTCEHLGDGVTALYYDGTGYDEIWPLWNWQQLPGITCEQDLKILDPCAWDFPEKQTTFVGAVTDSHYGAAGMDLFSKNIRYHSSWFMFDNGYTQMTQITERNSTNPVFTNIVNRILKTGKTEPVWLGTTDGKTTQLPSGHHDSLKNVKWIYHEKTAYLLYPHSASSSQPIINIMNGDVSGNWYTIGVTHQNITKALLTVNIDHYPKSTQKYFPYGGHPTQPIYSHIVVPNVASHHDVETVWKDKNGYTLIEVSDQYQAVCHSTTGQTQIIYWGTSGGHIAVPSSCQSGGITSIISSASSMVMARVTMQDNKKYLVVSASNPDVESGLELDIHVLGVQATQNDNTCSAVSGGTQVKFNLPMGEAMGKSVTYNCTL